ncbi:hypothetical protein WJX74_007942 [Apatococcus lobatus]|uniref:Uncharacterized protein n=1 Tax=Apatococcus lobatus TaxID=904363 RepID=A0AAW1SF44_9CHLO
MDTFAALQGTGERGADGDDHWPLSIRTERDEEGLWTGRVLSGPLTPYVTLDEDAEAEAYGRCAEWIHRQGGALIRCQQSIWRNRAAARIGISPR